MVNSNYQSTRTNLNENTEWVNYRSIYPTNFLRDNIREIPKDFIITLNNDETQRLKTAASELGLNPYIESEREEFITESQALSTVFNENTVAAIKESLQSFGAVFIKNLPIDENLPDTPTKGGNIPPDYKSSFVSEAILLALGYLTEAEPFNFRQEGLGTSPLIDNIVTVKALAEQKGSGGFKNNFPFHCESAWHRKRPDYVVLFGQRKSIDAKTLFFSSAQLNEYFIEGVNDYVDSFRISGPELYDQMQEKGIPLGTAPYSYKPPIEKIEGKIKLNLNLNGTESADKKALEWLFQLEKFIEENCYGVMLEPQSAIFLNNDLTCHTRTGYTPQFNGKGRWFLRGYFKTDLRRSDKLLIEEYLQDLLKLGWIDKEGKLTSSFQKYIDNPSLLKSLPQEKKTLAEKATFLTPGTTSRIV